MLWHGDDNMVNTKHCLNCKRHDIHFEGKFCSIECADLYEGLCLKCEAIKHGNT